VWSNRIIAPVCEDLGRYGVVLVTPATAEYFELLADIERRLQTRPPGSPSVEHDAISRISEHDTGSAILLNKAQVAIASLSFIWSFSGRGGRIIPHSFTLTNPSVLLPFGQDDRSKKFHAFRNKVSPGQTNSSPGNTRCPPRGLSELCSASSGDSQ
jgi:hypothetical protein